MKPWSRTRSGPHLFGWTHPFSPVPWDEIVEREERMAQRYPQFQHMADIAHSVVASGSTSVLAACTSMHDLLVVTAPLPEPPFDLVAVRAPNSLREPPPGSVRIEHLSCSGRNDVIERPVAEAVPLFWRFMIEKYGVHPVRPPGATGH